MKTKLFFSMLLLLQWSISEAQVTLTVNDCNNLTTHLEVNSNNKISHSFLLEKLIGPEIWSEKQKELNKSEAAIFENLPIGFYRVTCISQEITKTTSQVRHFHEKIVSKTIEIKNCIEGLEESSLANEGFMNETTILLFPNPTRHTLQLVLQEEMENAYIHFYDLAGKKVRSEKINSTRQSFDVSSLNLGIYMLVIEKNGQLIKREKLVLMED